MADQVDGGVADRVVADHAAPCVAADRVIDLVADRVVTDRVSARLERPCGAAVPVAGDTGGLHRPVWWSIGLPVGHSDRCGSSASRNTTTSDARP